MDYFKDVVVEGGPQHYAEEYNDSSYLKMPFNAIVNGGYVLLGIYWLYRISSKQFHFPGYFTLFSILAIIYGPIQFMRIVTQDRFWGLMDQWITLPFFSLVPAWNVSIHRPSISIISTIGIEMISLGSFLLATISPIGFEIALGFHVLVAVIFSIYTIYSIDAKQRGKLWRPFILAILSCLGFVILKLGDHHLVHFSPFFKILSGHFWSKLCDISQILFVLSFFEEISIIYQQKLKSN